MPIFKVEWTMTGDVTVEADDADEAEGLVAEGLTNLDHTQFESIDCDEVTIDSTEELK